MLRFSEYSFELVTMFEWLQVRVVWHVDYSKSTPADVAVLESVSLLFNNYTLFPSFMLM